MPDNPSGSPAIAMSEHGKVGIAPHKAVRRDGCHARTGSVPDMNDAVRVVNALPPAKRSRRFRLLSATGARWHRKIFEARPARPTLRIKVVAAHGHRECAHQIALFVVTDTVTRRFMAEALETACAMIVWPSSRRDRQALRKGSMNAKRSIRRRQKNLTVRRPLSFLMMRKGLYNWVWSQASFPLQMELYIISTDKHERNDTTYRAQVYKSCEQIPPERS